MRSVLDRPLDILTLPEGCPASGEGGGWQLCDVWIHSGNPNRSHGIMRISGCMFSAFVRNCSNSRKTLLKREIEGWSG